MILRFMLYLMGYENEAALAALVRQYHKEAETLRSVIDTLKMSNEIPRNAIGNILVSRYGMDSMDAMDFADRIDYHARNGREGFM